MRGLWLMRAGYKLGLRLARLSKIHEQVFSTAGKGYCTSPLQAMKDWHKPKTELFRKQRYYLPGGDTYLDKGVILASLGQFIAYVERHL